MKNRTPFIIVTVVVFIAAFLLAPNGPLGTFWDIHPESHTPTGVQIPLFILFGALDALSLGFGVAFLIFGYSLVEAIGSTSKGLARAAHLSVAWLLINWWFHDNLHAVNGPEVAGLLGIEYGFHATLMVAGVILVTFFVKLLGKQQQNV